VSFYQIILVALAVISVVGATVFLVRRSRRKRLAEKIQPAGLELPSAPGYTGEPLPEKWTEKDHGTTIFQDSDGVHLTFFRYEVPLDIPELTPGATETYKVRLYFSREDVNPADEYIKALAQPSWPGSYTEDVEWDGRSKIRLLTKPFVVDLEPGKLVCRSVTPLSNEGWFRLLYLERKLLLSKRKLVYRFKSSFGFPQDHLDFRKSLQELVERLRELPTPTVPGGKLEPETLLQQISGALQEMATGEDELDQMVFLRKISEIFLDPFGKDLLAHYRESRQLDPGRHGGRAWYDLLWQFMLIWARTTITSGIYFHWPRLDSQELSGDQDIQIAEDQEGMNVYWLTWKGPDNPQIYLYPGEDQSNNAP